MTRDEKLAVIAGNIRDAGAGSDRINGFIEGTLYELALIAYESDSAVLDTARLVLPEDEPVLLAKFCRIYHKYYGDHTEPIPLSEPAEHSFTVAIPEIPRLDAALDILRINGIQLDREYGDSFASCAEDVAYGDSGYVLMPYSDPSEGRLRTFDRLRNKYGLKIHCVVYVSDDEGGEYSYQLCGPGFPDNAVLPLSRVSVITETTCDPVKYLDAVRVFGAEPVFAEIETAGNTTRIKTVLDIENTDNTVLGGLFMYLNAAADITIDGIYAEIHHKSKGL